jgi:hypothetical protein
VANVVPNPSDVKLVVCEFARQEADGKFSLLGVFPGNQIQVKGATTPTVPIPALALVFIIDGAAGVFDSAIDITAGATPLHITMSAEMKGSRRGYILTQVYGLPLAAGTFVVKLTLDTAAYNFSIEVQFV